MAPANFLHSDPWNKWPRMGLTQTKWLYTDYIEGAQPSTSAGKEGKVVVAPKRAQADYRMLSTFEMKRAHLEDEVWLERCLSLKASRLADSGLGTPSITPPLSPESLRRHVPQMRSRVFEDLTLYFLSRVYTHHQNLPDATVDLFIIVDEIEDPIERFFRCNTILDAARKEQFEACLGVPSYSEDAAGDVAHAAIAATYDAGSHSFPSFCSFGVVARALAVKGKAEDARTLVRMMMALVEMPELAQHPDLVAAFEGPMPWTRGLRTITDDTPKMSWAKTTAVLAIDCAGLSLLAGSSEAPRAFREATAWAMRQDVYHTKNLGILAWRDAIEQLPTNDVRTACLKELFSPREFARWVERSLHAPPSPPRSASPDPFADIQTVRPVLCEQEWYDESSQSIDTDD